MNNRTLEEDRQVTINNIRTDISKIDKALNSIKDLTIEGNILREDLLGLLHFNEESKDQVDALMIERRKIEAKSNNNN